MNVNSCSSSKKIEIVVCNDGSVLADRGPMFLNILVMREGHPDLNLAKLGVNRAFSLLEELAKGKSVITKNILQVNIEDNYPPVIRRMIDAVLQTGDNSLTPLAAVAGAVSDEVGDFLFQKEGVSKVLVNNGGDIALRLRQSETAKVGITLDYFKPEVSHVLTVSTAISGVATSGFGGKSFTKGIASAVVVWASTAALADASAKPIANSTYVKDAQVHQQLAEEIYPDTDIPGHLVTTFVGDISDVKIEEALDRGMTAANKLRDRGVVFETLISVKGRVRMTEGMASFIHSVN